MISTTWFYVENLTIQEPSVKLDFIEMMTLLSQHLNKDESLSASKMNLNMMTQ